MLTREISIMFTDESFAPLKSSSFANSENKNSMKLKETLTKKKKKKRFLKP